MAQRTERALREGIERIRSMLWHVTGAVAIAALVMGYLPDGLLLDVAGPGRPIAIPAAALVGVPFYISVEALAPVGAALSSTGMSMGTVFALTVAGAGVNIPELALLSKIITKRGRGRSQETETGRRLVAVETSSTARSTEDNGR